MCKSTTIYCSRKSRHDFCVRLKQCSSVTDPATSPIYSSTQSEAKPSDITPLESRLKCLDQISHRLLIELRFTRRIFDILILLQRINPLLPPHLQQRLHPSRQLAKKVRQTDRERGEVNVDKTEVVTQEERSVFFGVLDQLGDISLQLFRRLSLGFLFSSRYEEVK